MARDKPFSLVRNRTIQDPPIVGLNASRGATPQARSSATHGGRSTRANGAPARPRDDRGRPDRRALGARRHLGAGPESIHDPATLGRRITVCDRQLEGPGAVQTLAWIHAVVSGPVLVDPAPLAPCPQGACTRVAAGACATVVYVRVGEDAYVAYELVGGP